MNSNEFAEKILIWKVKVIHNEFENMMLNSLNSNWKTTIRLHFFHKFIKDSISSSRTVFANSLLIIYFLREFKLKKRFPENILKGQNLKYVHVFSRHFNVKRYELAPLSHVHISGSDRLCVSRKQFYKMTSRIL